MDILMHIQDWLQNTFVYYMKLINKVLVSVEILYSHLQGLDIIDTYTNSIAKKIIFIWFKNASIWTGLYHLNEL